MSRGPELEQQRALRGGPGGSVNKTSIEWTDYTSNLIRYRDPRAGAQRLHQVSAGCANRYASAWSARGLLGEQDGAFTAKRQATLAVLRRWRRNASCGRG